jgi:cytochrome c
MGRALAWAAAAGLFLTGCGGGHVATADRAAVARGLAIAEANCARCHAVGPAGVSPLAAAPPFRTFKEHYPIDDLAESLAEGIVTGHPEMPAFDFTPEQIDDLLAYLGTL